MYTEDFPHFPKQVTINQVWHITRKTECDDKEIEAAKIEFAAERKAAKKVKRFSRGRSKSTPPNIQ